MSLSQAYASTTAGSSSSFGAVLREARTLIRDGLQVRRSRARARQELESYSDRQLQDLGISRSDIPSIVAGTYAR